ncbi:hypothetical protein NP493_6635g00000 [Ridgeia piscesae]|uniref:C2H2-type domain-containing protein n=1 Tax=Ridgeia piscesae TaxID=27915 RepID=A0AAD9MMG8_RIDPI|nr:hypothetical protein NP493_6635g00000 [Ridgeia piscesae]
MSAPKVIYKCESCPKVFDTKKELLVHQYNHKEKPYTTCDTCNKTLPNELLLKRHMKLHNRKGRTRTCPICSEVFESVRMLEDHHRLRHLEEKKFHCQYCSATFSWGENLRRHERMHATETHPCSHCNKGFMDATSLRTHIRREHPRPDQDPDKPFVCRICGKCFKFDFSYEAHLNSHEVPFERKKAASVAVSNKNGDGTMKEFIVEIVNEPGQPMAQSVTIDPENFMERFVEPPVGGDEGTEKSENVVEAAVEGEVKEQEKAKEEEKPVESVVPQPKVQQVADAKVDAVQVQVQAATVPGKQVEGAKPAVKQVITQVTVEAVPDTKNEEKVQEEVNGEGQDAAEPVTDEPKEKATVPPTPEAETNYQPQVRKKRPYRRVSRPPPGTAVKDASDEEEEEATTPKKRQKRKFVGNSRIVRRRSSSESDGDYDEDAPTEDGVAKGKQTPPQSGRKSVRKAAQNAEKGKNEAKVQNGEPLSTRRTTRTPTKRAVEVDKKGKPTPTAAATSKRVTRPHPVKLNTNGEKVAVKKGKTFTAVVQKKTPLKKSTVVAVRPMALRKDAKRTRSQRTGNTRGQVDGSMDDMSADDELDLSGEALPRILEGDGKGDYERHTFGRASAVSIEGAPVVAAHLSWRRQLWQRRSLYPCRYCEKFFTSKPQRASHLLRHTGRYWYTCTVCATGFPDDCSLAVHQLTHRVASQCYCCAICAQSFSDKQTLFAHRRRHVVSKSVACTVCGKRYGNTALLAKHEADHVAGIFTCNICHKSFTKRHAFDIHQKSGCIFSAFSTDDM